MAPIAKHRGSSKQLELSLEKYLSSLDGVPDEATLGRLQTVLETLISERSHPMIVGLSKQLEQLKTAENVIERERESRKTRTVASHDRITGHNQTQTKRKWTQRDDQVHDNDEGEGDNDEANKDLDTNINETGEAGKTKVDSIVKKELDASTTQIDSTGRNKPAGKSGSDNAEKDGQHQGDIDEKVEDDEGYGDQSGKREAGSIPSNKKFVSNPKSEFVPSQSLPYHTFGLFDEQNDSEDEEMYKRRLGVVSYPHEDLSTLTAGPVPMDDFTRAKPANQVQFSTYSTFLEPYFKPFSDEDIQFLQQPAVGSGVEAANLRGGKRLSPFAFPPLGPHYREQWAIQDAELAGTEPTEEIKKELSSRSSSLAQMYLPRGSVHDLTEQSVESSKPAVSLGPFTERLIAAVMPEIHETNPSTPYGNSGIDNDEVNMDAASSPPEKAIASLPLTPAATPLIDDFGHLEERVKSEFKYVGVLDMSLLRKFEKTKSDFKLALPQSRDEYSDPSIVEVDWVNGSEDDEISRELRLLQRKLKEVSRRNAVYKSRLLPIVQEQLAWQEYQSILQDLDKQVDQAYLKRLKQPKVAPPKQKKRKDSVGFDSPSDTASPAISTPTVDSTSTRLPDQKPAIKALMEKRERWITKIGPLFRPAYEMMREYEHPKFNEIDDDEAPEDEEEEERDDQ